MNQLETTIRQENSIVHLTSCVHLLLNQRSQTATNSKEIHQGCTLSIDNISGTFVARRREQDHRKMRSRKQKPQNSERQHLFGADFFINRLLSCPHLSAFQLLIFSRNIHLSVWGTGFEKQEIATEEQRKRGKARQTERSLV